MTAVVSGFERFFDGLGLMTGEFAISKRMIVGGLLGAFVVTYFKPSYMFESGQPRPWSLTAAPAVNSIQPPFHGGLYLSLDHLQEEFLSKPKKF